jgi:hypothetical protein
VTRADVRVYARMPEKIETTLGFTNGQAFDRIEVRWQSCGAGSGPGPAQAPRQLPSAQPCPPPRYTCLTRWPPPSYARCPQAALGFIMAGSIGFAIPTLDKVRWGCPQLPTHRQITTQILPRPPALPPAPPPHPLPSPPWSTAAGPGVRAVVRDRVVRVPALRLHHPGPLHARGTRRHGQPGGWMCGCGRVCGLPTSFPDCLPPSLPTPALESGYSEPVASLTSSQ